MADEPESPIDDEGGETSCYAHLVCPDCGIVVDGSPHRVWCNLTVRSAPSSDQSLHEH